MDFTKCDTTSHDGKNITVEGGKHHWRGGKGETCFSFQVNSKSHYCSLGAASQEFSVQVTEKQFVTSRVNGNMVVCKPSRSGMETYFMEAPWPPASLLGEAAICC